MILTYLLTICIIMIVIASLALKDNFKSWTNKLFFVFIFFFDFWIIDNYISNTSSNYSLVYFTNQLIFASTTLLVLSLAYFIKVYPNSAFNINKLFVLGTSFIGAFVFFLSLTNLIVENIKIHDGYSDVVFGSGIYFYLTFFILLLGYSIVTLFIKFRKSHGIEKLKVQYLTFGILLTSLLTVVTNIILPVVYNTSSATTFGTGFSLFLVVSTGYSIIKHKLLGIRLLIGNILLLLIVSGFTLGAIYGITNLESTYIPSISDIDNFSLNVLISTVFSGLFILLYTQGYRLIRKTFIHTSYDPSVELENFDRAISTSLNKEEVTNAIRKSLKDVLKVSYITIVLFEKERKDYFGEKDVKIDQIENTKIVDFFKSLSNEIILQYELESLTFSAKATITQIEIFNIFKLIKASAFIPLTDVDGFKGIIIIGSRSTVYDKIDLEFLQSVARSAIISIQRAIYFSKYERILVTQEKTIADQTRQLKELAEEQKNIIDVMGHEIRTPLSVINNEVAIHEKVTIPNLKKWLNKEESEDDIKIVFDSFGSIQKAIVQANALVSDMLEAARLDKGRFELNYKKFDIIALVKESVELMSKTIDNKETTSIQFVSINLNQLEIEADDVRITQAVHALISNALKYGINKQTNRNDIFVKVECHDPNFVEVSINDSGEGIRPEDIETLGQKFMRLNANTPNLPRPGGTGLGLFVVKNIMLHHKGELIIRSEGVNKGSSFILKIPIKKLQ